MSDLYHPPGKNESAWDAPVRFKLHPITLCFVFLLGVLVFFAAVAGRSVTSISGSVGAAAVLFLLCLGVAYAAFRLSRRSNRVANIVLCVLLVLPLLAGVRKAAQTRRESVALDRMMVDLRDYLSAMSAEFASTGDTREANSQSDRIVDRMRQTSEDIGGDLGELMAAVVVRISDLAPAARDYRSALDAFEESGGVDPSELRKKSNVRERLKRVETLNAANEKLLDTFGNYRRGIDADIARLSVSTRVRDAFLSGVSAAGQFEVIEKIREEDRTVIGSFKEMLVFFEENWGEWKYEKALQQLVFEDDALLDEYNGILEKMQASAQRQTELMRGLLDSMQARLTQAGQ